MKIAVLGSKGMLGYAVSKYFSSIGVDVLAMSRSEYDIAKDEFEKFEKLILNYSPDFIVNCAGVIKPQIAKMSIEDVLRVNSIFPHNLALFSNKHGIKSFHITTDCVYTGKKGSYTEEDYFDASDVYGMSKNAGEPRSIMTLRTSIIGEENNQSRSLIEWAKSQANKEVNGFSNHLWNGVTTLQVAQTIDRMIKTSFYKPGLFHLHSPAKLTKYEMLEVFNRVYNLNMRINKIEAPEAVDRSLASLFPVSKDFVVDSIETQVKNMRAFFQ